MAVFGDCSGGAMVLHLAHIGTGIDKVPSFHSKPGCKIPAGKDNSNARVVVFHGEGDHFIPTEQVIAFKGKMQNAGEIYEFIAYPNVKHSFTNPQADEFGKEFNLPALQYN